MYGMDAYLMIMHELEKARLADQVRKSRQKEGLSLAGSPPAAMSRCIRERTRRR